MISSEVLYSSLFESSLFDWLITEMLNNILLPNDWDIERETYDFSLNYSKSIILRKHVNILT